MIRRRAILILCAAVLGIYHLVAAQVMYPVPGGDAVVFMPPAINLKAGQGLTNPLWNYTPDPTGQDRFYEHPPLFQLAVSACMWKAETQNAFMVLAIFNVLTLWLYAAFLCRAKIAGQLIISSRRFVLLLLSIFALAYLVFNSSEGRPETLSTLLLAIALGIRGTATERRGYSANGNRGESGIAWVPPRWRVWFFGLLIGATAAVHPTNGILIACLVLLAFFLRDNWAAAIRNAFFAATIALGLFWFLLALGPYGVRETLHALSVHSAFAYSAEFQTDSFVTYYLKLAPWSGLYLGAVSLFFGFCALHFWKFTQDRTVRGLQLAVLFLTGLVFWFFTVRSPNKSYYLIMLAPALAAGAIYFFKASSSWRGRKLEIVAVWASAVVGTLFSLLLIRDVALFVNYRLHGVSFVEAREEFRKVQRSTTEPIFVSESLWVLEDHFERIRIVERGTGAGEIMVVQQSQRQSLAPPVISGYHVVADRFLPYRPSLFGFPLGNTMPGYAFAVFEKDSIQESGRKGAP